MKKVTCWLILLLGVGLGCMPMPKQDKPQQVPQTQMRPKTPPVMAEDVSETNTAEVTKRLRAEIEADKR